MTDKLLKQHKRLLEQQHKLPYTINLSGEVFTIIIYTKLSKVAGVTVLNSQEEPATVKEAEAVVNRIQKYNFYFEYLGKRAHVIKERDSIIAEKIEQTQLILNDNTIFGEKMQPTIDELNLAMEVYKQQQRKMDVYQEDITLLNQKIKMQGEILEEDWESAENLSIAFAKAAYAQSIYLEATRKNRKQLAKWFHLHQKELPTDKQKALSKMVSVLSDTNAGLVFDQIISLRPLLEEGLMLDHEQSLTQRAAEFNKEFETHCRFYKPNINKVKNLIRQ
ncbi:hypothetical protein ACOC6V_002007 [Listeria monocytogenes]|mgnify:FL=1|uniref:Uncharacterized protein n=7 Tax=Listeria monocytogenes TaxID=1639 RepID=A0A0B8RHY1_LISMN|nr:MULTISPECIES: hypothetical protein [Listeria]EAE1678814.1 hypothetical protein [Listeria monocytogenes LIS0071]EAE3705655.1 hypothetical protein [Listeria monocytogenes serotype 1/2b]EAF3076505.1 hypothetical protein [Listeria monocytogenes serotype 1/2a]EAG6253412.1 hypothetical protein [Listeria monocytogenes CFSAN003806]EAG6260798.1 hypothetical protein [Listeria monocytogenes CFSAN003725]EAG6331693.1 hypothetical protein [Listeria monocytogenes CFSAN002346]EAG6349128.1 hypothetical pr